MVTTNAMSELRPCVRRVRRFLRVCEKAPSKQDKGLDPSAPPEHRFVLTQHFLTLQGVGSTGLTSDCPKSFPLSFRMAFPRACLCDCTASTHVTLPLWQYTTSIEWTLLTTLPISWITLRKAVIRDFHPSTSFLGSVLPGSCHQLEQ